MASQAAHRAPSGRFIRAYLLTWGLLAAGGLVYLASLAWHPELFSASPQVAKADPTLQAANRALAEVGTVRRTVTEIQSDLSRLKGAIDRREAEDKAAQARLAALEERVTTLAPQQAAAEAVPAPTARLRTLEKSKQVVEKGKTVAEPPNAPTRIISVTEAPKAATPAPEVKTEEQKIETGSIVAPVEITFGEPEVTPAKQAFAVQLAAGPSLESLRLSWNLLRERHGGALASLQPRFLPPRSEGGPYRLLAGPLPTKADADKICEGLGTGRKGCFSTPYVGQPL